MRYSRALRRAAAERRPMYARALGLRHLELSGLACFVLFEGALTLGTLLALAELASWWTVLALPVAVAVMVKFNDTVAGSLRTAARTPVRAVVTVASGVAPAVGRARVVPAQIYRAGVQADAGVVRATASVAVFAPGSWVHDSYLDTSGPPAGSSYSAGPWYGAGPWYDAGSSYGADSWYDAGSSYGGSSRGSGSAHTSSSYGSGAHTRSSPGGGSGSESGRGPARSGGARHRVGRQRRERPREGGHAARHSASRRYR